MVVRAAGFRLRTDRGRAPLARGAAARLDAHPRRDQGGRRPHPAHARAHREPPARRPLAHRRGPRLPAPAGTSSAWRRPRWRASSVATARRWPTCSGCSSCPTEVRDLVDHGALSDGHARALLGLTDAKLIEQAGAPGGGRRLVGAGNGGAGPAGAGGRQAPGHQAVGAGPRQRRSAAGRGRAAQAARHRRPGDASAAGRGIVQLSYYSNDDLARLLELILGAPFEG